MWIEFCCRQFLKRMKFDLHSRILCYILKEKAALLSARSWMPVISEWLSPVTHQCGHVSPPLSILNHAVDTSSCPLCNKTPAAVWPVKCSTHMTSSKHTLFCVIEQLPPWLICHQWGRPLSWFTRMPTRCLAYPFDSIKRFADEVSGTGQNNSHFHGKMVSITACASLC